MRDTGGGGVQNRVQGTGKPGRSAEGRRWHRCDCRRRIGRIGCASTPRTPSPELNIDRADVTIVGAGLVGLATARALLNSKVTDAVRILEKEPGVARHQSSHNSGVLHAGLAYRPGSAKARLARDGIRRMTAYCRHHDVPHDICGKLVVAVRPDEVPRLDALAERGRRNGLVGLRRIGPAEATEIEPQVRCLAALHVPEEGIVSFPDVAQRLADEVRRKGGVIEVGAEVHRGAREGRRWTVETTAGAFDSRIVVNCAGLHADRVARCCGSRPALRILPFRGEYMRLRDDRTQLVRHLIYPVARPGFPFLGVHLTRRTDGTVDAGPNAVLALAREGYRRGEIDGHDLIETLTTRGLWRFVARHPRMVAEELGRSLGRRRFGRALRTMVPAIRDDDLVEGSVGVRAQAVRPNGTLVDDFFWDEAPGAIHVLNAPSPAATASLSIGRAVAARVARALRAGRGSA